jgi:hypothetical protein
VWDDKAVVTEKLVEVLMSAATRLSLVADHANLSSAPPWQSTGRGCCGKLQVEVERHLPE